MESVATITPALAVWAGGWSFLSPCVLPLIPAYVAFITGVGLADAPPAPRAAFRHGLIFLLGFTVIFLALGATSTSVGLLLFSERLWITRAGSVLLIVFGSYVAALSRNSAPENARRAPRSDTPLGYLATVLVGAGFGAGWTPCIGPVLGGILALTSSTAGLRHGLVLLTSYALGLALPFIGSAWLISRLLTATLRGRTGIGSLHRVAGALLVIVGAVMLSGAFTTMTGWLADWTPALLRSRL